MPNRHMLRLRTACFLLGASNLAAQTASSRADSATVRLAPSAFPALPASVRRDLENRGCRVPQVPTLASKPHNVIQGAFLAPGNKDWAVLCSIGRSSQILVYANGADSVPHSLGNAEDSNFLQRGIGANGEPGFSRLISVARATEIRLNAAAFNGPPPPKVLDHVGISDAFVEKASTILYFHNGKWMKLQGAD